MGERGTYVPTGGGSGATLKERKRLARRAGNSETPAERKRRLKSITNVSSGTGQEPVGEEADQ